MDKARIKQVMRLARKVPPSQLHDLFFEVYGADYGGALTDDRARISIREACEQLLGTETITRHETPQSQEVSDIGPTSMVQAGETPAPIDAPRRSAPRKPRKPLRLEPL